MGRLRCPPTPSPPAHGPSARCWGAWKEPPRVGSPRPAARGEEQEQDVSDARHHHAQLRLLQHPRQHPCASRQSPCSSIPPRSWVGGLGKGLSRAFLGGIGALLGLRGSGWLPQRAAWVEVSHSWAAAPGGEGLGQMVNQSPAAPNGAVPDKGFAALVLPRLFHSPPISLSDPLCSICTAAARLAGGEFQGDRGGRGFSSQMCAKHGLGSKPDGGGGSRPLENTLSKHPAAGCGLRTVPRQVTATDNTHSSLPARCWGLQGPPLLHHIPALQ